MMTIHAAKGLEFAHVFVVEAAGGDTTPSGLVPPAVAGDDGIVHVPVPAADGKCHRTSELEACVERAKRERALEDQRLWYVALTRAEVSCTISGAWDFRPTTKGGPRARRGALRWLGPVLGIPEQPLPERSSSILDGAVTLDTHGPSRTPHPVWRSEDRTVTLAAVEPAPQPAVDAAAHAAPPLPERSARAAVAAALGTPSGSSAAARGDRDLGTRVHALVARALNQPHSSELPEWVTPEVQRIAARVLAAPVLTALRQAGARAEVPWMHRAGDTVESGTVDSSVGLQVAATDAVVTTGRFDAVAQLAADTWWIVDWKLARPEASSAAWSEHAAQLLRYAQVARAAGAATTLVTLASLTRPEHITTWRITAESSAEHEPKIVELPVQSDPTLA
jgi:ATP-dependent exoDNAse (exonuclease V) beta subunit